MLHQLQKFVEVHGPVNFDVVNLKITIPLYPYISQPSYPNYSENSCDPPWMWYKGRRTPRKGKVSTKAFFILMNEKLLLLLDIYDYFSQLLALVIIYQMTWFLLLIQMAFVDINPNNHYTIHFIKSSLLIN